MGREGFDIATHQLDFEKRRDQKNGKERGPPPLSNDKAWNSAYGSTHEVRVCNLIIIGTQVRT